jgi:hypothetical protein
MTRIVRSLLNLPSPSENTLNRFRPTGFASAGLTGAYDRSTNTFNLTRTPEREAALAGVTGAYAAKQQAFAGLREQVTPGFGKLTTAMKQSTAERIAAIRDEGRRTVGNIRENLARRRLAGSSFQSSEVAAGEAEFARKQDVARAEGAVGEANAYLSELEASSALMKEEFDSSIASAATILQDLGFDADIVSKMAALSSQLWNDNLKAQAEARAAQDAASEDFIGTIIGAIAGGMGASDVRLKRNIRRIGALESGLSVYEYDIFDRHEIGVLAQEAMVLFPRAVLRHSSGYLMVDYTRIR